MGISTGECWPSLFLICQSRIVASAFYNQTKCLTLKYADFSLFFLSSSAILLACLLSLVLILCTVFPLTFIFVISLVTPFVWCASSLFSSSHHSIYLLTFSIPLLSQISFGSRIWLGMLDCTPIGEKLGSLRKKFLS